MPPRMQLEGQALLNETSLNANTGNSKAEFSFEGEDLEDILPLVTTAQPRWWATKSTRRRDLSGSPRFVLQRSRRRRSPYRWILQILPWMPYILLISIMTFGLFLPSYSHPPRRYQALRHGVNTQGLTGNVNNEKIFIAASLHDPGGRLISGRWGRSVLRLIDVLGQDNVFLSLYENNADDQAKAALVAFARNLTCQSSVVTESLDFDRFQRVWTKDGSQRLKRIAFLASVRNRALRPLEDSNSQAYGTRFDKLLYLNDVVFDPVDAANLLFSTNIDERTGRTKYRAACGIDFINPFKFYDTFATRDLEGYDMGVPFYPWFSGAGRAESRGDVLQQKDAVRVKSCWGGMIAYEARWFQKHLGEHHAGASMGHVTASPTFRTDMRDWTQTASNTIPLRFRAEDDTYWDASECCLINADLSALDTSSLEENDTGIYMNPYIRVAYSEAVFAWLSAAKRFERLYTPIQALVNRIAERPSRNVRQFQEPGQAVLHQVWDSYQNLSSTKSVQGRFRTVRRTALPGGFCGMPALLYINENPSNGKGKWASEKMPVMN